MSKDFDTWNMSKKLTHHEAQHKLYHAREMWWCVLGVNVGFEQDGTGRSFERPVLILRGFSKYVCIVVPLTTSKKENPFHASVGMVDGKEAFAIVSQLRLIDTRRLINKLGYLDNLGYPAIAFLLIQGVLEYDLKYAEALKDIPWKDINQKYKNDFGRTLEDIFVIVTRRGFDVGALQRAAEQIAVQCTELNLSLLGAKTKPPQGY
jgi:mRNA interferase MazF